MIWQFILLGATLLSNIIVLIVQTLAKSSVEEMIHKKFDEQSQKLNHQLEIERLKMREEFEREIHSVDRKDKFKLAALDKRLEAHQRAYSLAIKMIQTLRDTPAQKGEII